MRLYTIPTNRVCYEQAVSYVEEIEEVKNNSGETIEFLVLENGSNQVEKVNGTYFKAYNEQAGGTKIHYLTKAVQREWLEQLIKRANCADGEALLEILSSENVICYGAVLNKSFLIGASLEAESIHRRDSDTQLISDRSKPFPLEYEINFLGKSYRDFEELHSGIEEPIYFVGGNYTGAWAGDFGELYDKDPNLLYRHVGLNYPGRDFEAVKALVDKRYGKVNSGPQTADEDKVALVMDRMIELGNCAFSEVFKYYPVSPAKEMLATDYFIHDLLFALRLPNVYHSSRVFHGHTDERKNDEWFHSYHLRSARYKVYNRFMNRFFGELNGIGAERTLPKAKKLAALMNDVYEHSRHEFIAEGREVLAELGSIFEDSEIPAYVGLSSILRDSTEELLLEIEEGIRDFITLLDAWDALIAAAPSLPFPYEGSKEASRQ
ncbi:DUF6271 family protein [Paenibacillus sp. M1]|uniref:DUF6271 family protein n=1 Tax=Paenibacillus haidiansis TaxID=1574488 RepID=A0ABU7VUQ2_9BACL